MMRKLCIVASLAVLSFCVGCGDSNSGPTPQGNFSPASLNGNYAYQFQGFDLNTGNPMVRAGVLTFDGNGNITSGTDDFSEIGLPAMNAVTGSYQVFNDGTGSLTLTLPSGSLVFAITLVSSSKFNMIEADPTGFFFAGAGVGLKQDTAAFANPPNGTFIFRTHRISSSLVSTAIVGQMAISSGVINSGDEDVNVVGTGLTSPSITSGIFNFPDTSGRGTGSFTDSSANTIPFNYYVVDSTHIRLFTTDGQSGLGAAEAQSGGPFGASSLSGNYAYGLSGDTATNFRGIQTIGRFNASGGNLTAGASDSEADGVASLNQSFTGTYNVASNGRAVVNFNYSNGGKPQHIYWLVSPTRAFLLVNDSGKAADGTVDAQTVSSFSNSTMNGQFSLVQDGLLLNPLNTVDRVGTLVWDGKGGLTLNESVSISGAVNFPGFLNGSYSFDSSGNGRATGSISGSTNNVNWSFYAISGSDAYLIGTDAGSQTNGMVSLQH